MAERGLDVRVMFHEPYFYFSMERPWRNLLAVVQRMMAAELIKASRCRLRIVRCVDSVPEPVRRPAADADLADPVDDSRRAWIGGRSGASESLAAAIRRARSSAISAPMAITWSPSSRRSFPHRRAHSFCADSRSSAIAGRHFSIACRPVDPDVGGRAWASGRLPPPDVAAALRACDLLVQPYPDGVTTRRTSVMAGLANGVPIVATDGALTEAVWRETGATTLVPAEARSSCRGGPPPD